MDPDVNYEEQIKIARYIIWHLSHGDAGSEDRFVEVATRLAELVLALDEWMAHGGGFPPRRFERTPSR